MGWLTSTKTVSDGHGEAVAPTFTAIDASPMTTAVRKRRRVMLVDKTTDDDFEMSEE